MGYTVTIGETDAVTLTDVDVETGPERIDFSVDGRLSPTAGLLGSLAGSRLAPAAVTFAVDGKPVTIDLDEGDATLQLESIDVDVETLNVEAPDLDRIDASGGDDDGVGTPDVNGVGIPGDVGVPDADDLPKPDGEDLRSAVPDDVSTPDVATLSFSVEGVIREVGEDAIAELAAGEDVSIGAVQYGDDPDHGDEFGFGDLANDDDLESDGGERDPEVLLEIRLLGFGVAVWSDGTIDVGRSGSRAGSAASR